MKLRITLRNIVEAIPAHPAACPIAFALKDEGYFDPFVVGDWATARSPNGIRINWKLSKAAQRFITRFDFFQRVTPTTFVLTPMKVKK